MSDQTLRKVYRFRMEPNSSQVRGLERNADARRFVWNWGLEQKRHQYLLNGQNLPNKLVSRRLTLLKTQPEASWLKSADAQSLQQALRDLDHAYQKFFDHRCGAPRFKSKKRDRTTFRIPQTVAVSDGRVIIPKIGSVRIRQSRLVEGTSKSATFNRDVTGHWFVSLIVEFNMSNAQAPAPLASAVIGLDVGLHDFIVLSNGERVQAPRFFRKSERKLRRAQRVLKRRNKQSQRYLRARRRVSVIHRQIANKRGDFLHKLSTRLALKYEGICIEDLCVKGLARTKLAKSIADAAFGQFRRQLQYKAVWNHKHLIVIDRFFPSSRLCHSCESVNASLTLTDRTWICSCGAFVDRDFNAACNIRSEGLRILAAGHADSRNARGPDVRLPQVEAIGVEA